MPSPLGPGMRVMRRLGIASKLVAVVLLLLVPLAVSVAAGWRTASDSIAVLDRERAGTAALLPLVRLISHLDELDGPEGEGTSAVRAAVAGTDVSLEELARSTDLGTVTGRWATLRAQVLGLARAQGDPSDPEAAAAAHRRASALVDGAQVLAKQIADVSGLVLDERRDGYYMAVALSRELPAVLSATGRCRPDGTGATPLSTGALHQCRQLLTDTVDRLHSDLDSARAAMPAASGQDLRLAEESLSDAVALFAADLPDAPATATRPISAAGAWLGLTLADNLDERLLDRREALGHQRLKPLLLALVALLGAAYLVLALFRATTQDVRTVLSDINTVTAGALHQTPPLSGRDEFAQMSRAVVYARDRLTDLLGALRLQATHDDLTALGNRVLFTEKLQETLAERTATVAVLLVDLCRFSDVNDSFGHDTGDRLLRTVGARFHRAVGRRNLVARLGADEFAVLATEVSSSREVQQLVARLRVTLEDPIDIDGRRLRASATFGAVLHHPDGPETTTAADLIRRAAVALSTSKTSDQSGVALYEPWMQDRIRERTELATDLVSAYETGQFSVLYQPIVDIGTNTLHGVEALLRWVHPERGPISPDVFVPLAETSGLIVPLGRWVLQEAVEQVARWRTQFPDAHPLTLEVNLSADQLADASLPGQLLSLINRTGTDPGLLVLEITETALVRDLDLAVHRLGQLSAIGVRLALDDFGTGYSSLSYLRDLPVTVLKVDRAFVAGIESRDGTAARLLRSIIDLGDALRMEVIPEGIENETQLAALQSFGCRLGQGYLWSRPRPAEAVADLLREGGRIHGDARAAQPWPPPDTPGAAPTDASANTAANASAEPGSASAQGLQQ